MPYYSNYCFINVDPEFPSRCKEQGGGVIVGGANYGQGSSREHAALVPLYLGVKAVLCKSFARIHKANLVNSGIIPLTFADPADYDAINLLDEISLPNVLEEVKNGERVTVVCGGKTFKADCEVSERQRHALLCRRHAAVCTSSRTSKSRHYADRRARRVLQSDSDSHIFFC